MSRALFMVLILGLVACGDEGEEPQTPAGSGEVVINEIVAAGAPDFFELYNPSASTVDLTGWHFSEHILEDPQRGAFADGTSIGPGEFLLVEVDEEGFGFKLGSDEELAIFDDQGVLVDSVDWDEGDAPEGQSYGRFPDGEGSFKTLSVASPGEANRE